MPETLTGDHNASIDHLLNGIQPVSSEVLEQIASSGRNISTFAADLGLYAPIAQADNEQRLKQIPPERISLMQQAAQIMGSIPTLYKPLTIERINPDTEWENKTRPDLFFGMGGGSTSIIRGASLEALIMFMTAERMRRDLNLGRVRAILANRITYTNLPYSTDFLPQGISMQTVQNKLKKEGPAGIEADKTIQAKIDARMMAEREIYTLMAQKMGFKMDSWDIFLQTDIEDVIGSDAMLAYERTISAHNKILNAITGLDEYHYAQEDGIIDALVNGPQGGIKLGWWIRALDKVNGGYIMDEQPFHARWVVGQALRDDIPAENKVSLAYVYAAPRLYPDASGNLRKASPYICYDTEDMITMHPDDDVLGKFASSTRAGGGLNFTYTRDYYLGLVSLFENLTGVELNQVEINSQSIEIATHRETYRGERVAMKVKAMRDWLLEGIEDEVRRLWAAFETDSPEASNGLPVNLPTSKYYELLGIQPENLYYRIKKMSYGEETFAALADLYERDESKINLTRDLLVLCASIHEDVWSAIEKSGYFSPTTLDSDSVQNIYAAVNAIGENSGLAVLASSSYETDRFQPDETVLLGAKESGLHINPDVADYINNLTAQELGRIGERLLEFLTIVSYPNTYQIVSVAKAYGYDISTLSNRQLVALQQLAESFFEGRLKGSTPRAAWKDKYYPA